MPIKKSSLTLLSFFIFLPFQVLASDRCRDFTGTYSGADQVLIEISQQGCHKLQIRSQDQATQLILDDQVRLLEKGKTRNSYVTSQIKSETLEIILLISQQQKSWKQFDFKSVLFYTRPTSKTLQEENFLYDSKGKLLDYKKEIFRKLK